MEVAYVERRRDKKYSLAKQPAVLTLETLWRIQESHMHVLAGGVMGPEDRLRDSCGTGCIANKSIMRLSQ